MHSERNRDSFAIPNRTPSLAYLSGAVPWMIGDEASAIKIGEELKTKGSISMKIVLTTSGHDLSAPLDRRFGRAARFLVYDLEHDTFEVIDNAQNLNAAQGAGIQAAQTVVDTGAEAVVTGNCGPKAFRVLVAGGLKIYNSSDATVEAALKAYKAGTLAAAAGANVEGHWM
jgi:predicted Fe-Mo cluster-binding NifX family protein